MDIDYLNLKKDLFESLKQYLIETEISGMKTCFDKKTFNFYFCDIMNENEFSSFIVMKRDKEAYSKLIDILNKRESELKPLNLDTQITDLEAKVDILKKNRMSQKYMSDEEAKRQRPENFIKNMKLSHEDFHKKYDPMMRRAYSEYDYAQGYKAEMEDYESKLNYLKKLNSQLNNSITIRNYLESWFNNRSFIF